MHTSVSKGALACQRVLALSFTRSCFEPSSVPRRAGRESHLASSSPLRSLLLAGQRCLQPLSSILLLPPDIGVWLL